MCVCVTAAWYRVRVLCVWRSFRGRGQKQDPFVVLSLRNHLMAKAKTGVIKNGGINVEFLPQHNPSHLLCYNVRTMASTLTLDVEAFDWDIDNSNDLIGRGTVDVSFVVGKAVPGQTVQCPLIDDRLRQAGIVTLQISAGLRAGAGVVLPSATAAVGTAFVVCLLLPELAAFHQDCEMGLVLFSSRMLFCIDASRACVVQSPSRCLRRRLQ